MVASPPNSVFAAPVSEFGVPRNTYMGFSADHDKNTADLFTTKISHVATDWLTVENDTRAAVYSRDFRYTPHRCLRQHHCRGHHRRHQLCNLRLFGIAQPGAAPGSFNPIGTLVRTGGGGPYHQNSWGVQDIGFANANFHVGGLRNTLIAGFDASYQRADRTIYAYTLPKPGDLQPTSSARQARMCRRAPISASRCSASITRRRPATMLILPTMANIAALAVQSRRHQRQRHYGRHLDRRRPPTWRCSPPTGCGSPTNYP